MAIPGDQKEKTGLARQLGLFDTTMIIIGIVIGSGIFLTTGLMARGIPSASLILLAWLFGGLHALAGALAYSELGAAMPRAGGQYVYLREAYGPFCGFLFGWVSFTMYLTGIIAALAVGFAEYAGYFIPSFGMANVFFETEIALPGWTFQYSLSAGHVTALVLVVLLTVVNYRGVTLSKHITNVSSVIKVAALGLFILFGLWSGSAQPIDFRINPQDIDFGQLVVAFGVALIAVAWAFAGWEEVTFVAGEVRDPARNLPRALVVGTASVTVVYLLVNYIYLKAMPVGEMAGIVRVGEVAANVLFGETGAVLVSAAVIVSIVGALNASILVGPRVYFAMARDGLFFKRAGHGTSEVPHTGSGSDFSGRMGMRAHPQRYVRRPDYLCHLRQSHAVDRRGGRGIHPAQETARPAQALQSLGLPDCAPAVHRRFRWHSRQHALRDPR